MNIVIASGIYSPESGGPAQYASGLALALTKRGHDVSVITYGEKSGVSHADAWTVARVSRGGGAIVRYIRYFLKAFNMVRGKDIVFLQGAVSEGFPMTLAAYVRGVPTVLRVPGDYAWEQYQNLRAQDETLEMFLTKEHVGKIRIFEKIERWVAKHAAHIIVPSRYLKTVVERWGALPKLTTVILNAEHSLPEGSREEARKRFGVTDKTVCLTVVRAVPWKGVAELILWWNKLPDSHVLVIGGDGPEIEHWKKLAEGMKDRVRFVGRLHRQDLADWYRASDVFLLHSGYEGYPHVVAEAASLGLHCLVSDRGGNPETAEVFGDLITILPYQNSEAWVGALKHVSQRGEHKVVGEKQWSHAQMVECVESVLTKTVEGSGPLQTVMFSFDRGLVEEISDSWNRVHDLAGNGHVQVIILSNTSRVVKRTWQTLSVESFSGNALVRIVNAIIAGRHAVKRAPHRTVVSAQDPFIAGLVGYIVSRWMNVPLEIQEHGDFYSGYWAKESMKNRMLSMIGWFVLARAERVRAVSERVKDHLIKKGIKADQIDVIPVAIQSPTLHASSIASHPTGSVFRFVAPCRFVEQKGLDTLLEAAAKLKHEHIPYHISIIGRGPLLPVLHGLIEKHSLADVVTIEDWKERNEIWDNADGIVLSSRYEGFGRTILEAMTARVAIVSTDVGCVGSLLRSNIDGRVVPIDDATSFARAMKATILETEETKAMIASAHARATEFPSISTLHAKQRDGWQKILRSTLDVHPRFDLWVLGFVVFAFTTRLLSAFLFHHSLVNREWGFFTLVDHWFQGYGYSYATELGCPSAYRSPGFLFFLTALYSVFPPENTLAQALVQNVIAWLALILVYVVGKRFVGKKAALLGAFFMACYPYTFYHFTQYYHTFLSTFFLLFLVWTLLRLKENKKITTAILAGVSIAALAYTQGTILPATPFIVVWLLWMWWPDWKRTLLVSVIMAVVSAGMIAPWTYRNWQAFQAFVPLTTDLGHALFKANNEYIYEITKRGYPMETVDDPVVSSTNPNYIMFSIPPWLKAELEADGVYRDSIYWTEWHPKYPVGKLESCTDRGLMNEKQFSDYWMGRSIVWMKTYFWTDAWKLPLQKFKTFWQPGLFPSVKMGAPWSFANDPVKVFFARFAVWVSTFVIVWIGFVGVYLALKNKRREAVLIVILLGVYSLMHSLFVGYTKYRIPLDHLLAPFAAYAILVLYETRLRRK